MKESTSIMTPIVNENSPPDPIPFFHCSTNHIQNTKRKILKYYQESLSRMY